MKLKSILLAGVATATLSGAMIAPAIADDDTYTSGGQVLIDDQADETRALNIRALEAARDQDGSPMPALGDDNDADEATDGRGGPAFQGPPGPADYGVDDGEAEDADDMDDEQADEPDGTDDESTPD